MNAAHRRHDVTDKIWALLEPHLPGKEGVWGGRANDNQQFIKAVFWILRAGAPWRDLPPTTGGWSKTHRRFIRWRDKEIKKQLLERLANAPNFEWLMIAPVTLRFIRMRRAREAAIKI